jgi:hypothetical protein
LHAIVGKVGYAVFFASLDGVVVDYRGDPARADEFKHWGIWMGSDAGTRQTRRQPEQHNPCNAARHQQRHLFHSKHPDASQHHSRRHFSTMSVFAMTAALTADLSILRPTATFPRRLSRHAKSWCDKRQASERQRA